MFGFDEDSKKVHTIRMHDNHTSIVLDEEENSEFINLFLNDDNHFCVIKNLSRLVSSQLSDKKNKKHFCLSCMNGFSTDKILKTHQEVCLKHKN